MSKTIKFRKPTKEQLEASVRRASKKGQREAELEIYSGFPSNHSVHKSKKAYDRRKNKRVWED